MVDASDWRLNCVAFPAIWWRLLLFCTQGGNISAKSAFFAEKFLQVSPALSFSTRERTGEYAVGLPGADASLHLRDNVGSNFHGILLSQKLKPAFTFLFEKLFQFSVDKFLK